MPMYKIELVQVRKMTVYCSADDEEGAEDWLEENKDEIFEHLNLQDFQNPHSNDVYCYTAWGVTEDNSASALYDLLHGEEVQNDNQMEAVYKVLKQETKKDSDNGTTN